MPEPAPDPPLRRFRVSTTRQYVVDCTVDGCGWRQKHDALNDAVADGVMHQTTNHPEAGRG